MKKYCITRNIVSLSVAVAIGLVYASNVHAQELGAVNIHGFVSQGFYYSTDNNYLISNSEDGSFEINEMGINFSAEITDDLNIGVQLFSRDFGEIDNNELTVDWAFGDYRFSDYLGVRAGILKKPKGLFNETRDIDSLRVSVLLPQSVYNEPIRDVLIKTDGVGLYGNIPAGAVGDFSYNLIAGVTSVPNDGGTARFIEGLGAADDIEAFRELETYTAHLDWGTPLDGLKVVTSFNMFSAEVDATASGALAGTPILLTFDSYELYTVGTEYALGDLVLFAEFERAAYYTEVNTVDGSAATLAWYVGGSYQVNDWLQLGSYYAEFYGDEDDKDGDDLVAAGLDDFGAWQRTVALSTRFDINEYCSFKLEGHYNNGVALLSNVDNSSGYDEDWFFFASKLSFVF